jgi:hypothetical protein
MENMRRAVPVLLICCWTVGSSRGVPQPAADELSAEQKDAIDRGAQVFITNHVEGSLWPRASVYQYVDATPQEAAAVFWDFDRHDTYMPGLKSSRIARVIDPRTVEVDYVLGVPIMGDERYTVRDQLSRDVKGGSYRVGWMLVRASSTKAAEGSARFEPYRNRRLSRAGTLVAYVNLVSPGSKLAGIGFVRKKGLARVRETVRALVQRIEVERTAEPAVLAEQVATLRAALGA